MQSLVFILLASLVLLMAYGQEIKLSNPMEVVVLPQTVGEEELNGEQAVDVPRPKRFILGALLQGLAHSANRNPGEYYGKQKIKSIM